MKDTKRMRRLPLLEQMVNEGTIKRWRWEELYPGSDGRTQYLHPAILKAFGAKEPSDVKRLYDIPGVADTGDQSIEKMLSAEGGQQYPVRGFPKYNTKDGKRDSDYYKIGSPHLFDAVGGTKMLTYVDGDFGGGEGYSIYLAKSEDVPKIEAAMKASGVSKDSVKIKKMKVGDQLMLQGSQYLTDEEEEGIALEDLLSGEVRVDKETDAGGLLAACKSLRVSSADDLGVVPMAYFTSDDDDIGYSMISWLVDYGKPVFEWLGEGGATEVKVKGKRYIMLPGDMGDYAGSEWFLLFKKADGVEPFREFLLENLEGIKSQAEEMGFDLTEEDITDAINHNK